MVFTLAASGFRDTSRLAASDATMMLDILLTNSENVAKAMRAYSETFEKLAELVEQRNEPALRLLLENADAKRTQMVWAHLNADKRGA
jgi:prephenate dehydrogenase